MTDALHSTFGAAGNGAAAYLYNRKQTVAAAKEAVARVAPLIGTPNAASVFPTAEAAIDRLERQIDALAADPAAGDDEAAPLFAALAIFDRQIAYHPPATLADAAAKIRQLLWALAWSPAARDDIMVPLVQVLALIERMERRS
jgi:hypothetical protein